MFNEKRYNELYNKLKIGNIKSHKERDTIEKEFRLSAPSCNNLNQPSCKKCESYNVCWNNR